MNNIDSIPVPAEILELAFSNLEAKDIKSTRLVCRVFCTYSSPYLFDTVIISSHTKSLEKLEAIARHDVFRKSVRTLVYSASARLFNYATVIEYYNHMSTQYLRRQARLGGQPGALDESEPPIIEQCWREYADLHKDQQRLQRDGKDKIRIRDALCQMPNIKHLVLSDDLISHPLNTLWDHTVAIGPEMCRNNEQLSYAFNLMFFAFQSHKTLPISLRSTEWDMPWGIDLSCFSEQASPLFRSLREISLSLHSYLRERECAHALGKCLAAAPDLECLEISLKRPTRVPEPDFANILFGAWPRLSRLVLTMDIEYDPFVTFCKRHGGGALRVLHLERCRLVGGSLEMFAEVMRDCLRLTDVTLDEGPDHYPKSPEDGRVREVEHYILQGGESPFKAGDLAFGMEYDDDDDE